ncbi:MAG: class I SAM-dependent rRNA methyltransferase [Candidatus Rokubacteria bacterium]|nr:class I SAM-dependent rRNA methyltransferase [Candidatus Rokubacteria bacterium]
MAKLILKRGRDARVKGGHPWIYRSEVAEVAGDWRTGEAVSVLDGEGRFVGRGFYNPRPSLVCRLLTRQDEPVDGAFFRRRIAAALAIRREAGLVSDAFRVVWSEADGLPGLIVDRYASVAVIRCLTLGMTRCRPWIVEALRGPEGLADYHYGHDEVTAGRLEGFEPLRGWIDAAGPPEIEIREGPCRFVVSIEGGQKTGFYLDQRENRALVAGLAHGRRFLDVFCYSAAFACQGLAAGAARAVGIESSPEAVAFARRNLALNGLEDRAELREGNAFDLLRGMERTGERFDLVVLDPPPFTRTKAALEAAARGYKEINLRALRLLSPGGIVATFSCSHHVSPAQFEEICRAAAADARVTVRVLASLTQCRDHPILLNVPETRYLKGLLLEAIS